MPLKLYCPSCSDPTEYTLNKPIFCPMCGAKFEGSSNAIQLPKKESKAKIIVEDIEEIDVSNFSVQVKPSRDAGITFENLAKQQKTGLVKTKGKKVNKKLELEKFRKDAGFGSVEVIEIKDTGD
jgi:hypothetical protein